MSHEIYKSVDWLQWTVHDVMNWQKHIPFAPWDEIGEPIRPVTRYKEAYALLPAGRVDIAETWQQGAMFTFTGDTMRAWRNTGVHDDKSLVKTATDSGKVSRLDFAIDIVERSTWGERNIGAFREQVDYKLYKGSLKPDHAWDGQSKGGYTQYFGSKNSRNRVRIYDKAAEEKMETLWFAWCRVEMQTRKNQADLLARNMCSMGINPAGTERLQKLIRFPSLSWWGELMEIAPVEMNTTHRKKSSFQDWLIKQVAPAIRKNAKDLEMNAWLVSWLNGQLGVVREVGYDEFGT